MSENKACAYEKAANFRSGPDDGQSGLVGIRDRSHGVSTCIGERAARVRAVV